VFDLYIYHILVLVCLYVDYGPGLARESCMKGAVCHIYCVRAEYSLLLLHTNHVSELSHGHNITFNNHQHPPFIKPVN